MQAPARLLGLIGVPLRLMVFKTPDEIAADMASFGAEPAAAAGPGEAVPGAETPHYLQGHLTETEERAPAPPADTDRGPSPAPPPGDPVPMVGAIDTAAWLEPTPAGAPTLTGHVTLDAEPEADTPRPDRSGTEPAPELQTETPQLAPTDTEPAPELQTETPQLAPT